MRIALVVHQLPPEHLGGVEVYAWTLAQCLAEMGHQVAIFCPTARLDEAGESTADKVTLVRPYRPDPRSRWPLARFVNAFRSRSIERCYAAFVRSWQPDVVHLQHLQWVSARLVRLHGRNPTVLTLHDYWHICANSQLLRPGGQLCPGQASAACARCLLEGSGVSPRVAALASWPLAPLLTWRNRFVRRSALDVDQLLTPSPQAREVFLAAGFEAARLRSFDNGLDPSRLTGVTRPRPARSHTVFGYLGALSWQKGLHVLVKAFDGVPAQHELRIYGPQEAFPAYVQRLRAQSRHPGIRMLGPVAPGSVGEVLAELDYLVVPSLWAETFGMVAQEAQHVGVPVIASRIGALQRIRDGVDGHLFEPGDAEGLCRLMQHLVDHPAERDRLAAGIRLGPTIAAQAQHLVKLYHDLIRRSL